MLERRRSQQEFAAAQQTLCDLRPPATAASSSSISSRRCFGKLSPAALRSFGEELAAVVDEQSPLNIQATISIREEFLAQLTALDDFIPGVPDQRYYRLRKFTKKQARFVIESTAQASRRRDRRSARSSAHRSRDRRTWQPQCLRPLCRSALQDRLPPDVWDKESPRPGRVFLRSYEEGAARVELEACCREKLNTHLYWRRVPVAVEHLTGPHGPKKFVRVNDLARAQGRAHPTTRPTTARGDVRICAVDGTSRERGHVVVALVLGMTPTRWRTSAGLSAVSRHVRANATEEEQARAETHRTVLESAVAGTLAAVILVFGVLSPGLRWWFVGGPISRTRFTARRSDGGNPSGMRAAFARTFVLRPIGDLHCGVRWTSWRRPWRPCAWTPIRPSLTD